VNNSNWFSGADFWSLFYDYMFPTESFRKANEQVGDIMKLSGMTSGTVLDLCCGPGRHSVPFRKAGFEVTGVDLQQFFLDKAIEYASKENATIQFIKEDMRSFLRKESFDIVLSMYSSFGYFEDRSEDLGVLKNVFNSLRVGGQFLLDLRGKEVHAKNFTETISSEMPNGDLVFQRNKNSGDWTRAITTWIYVAGHRADSFKVTLNLYSGAEIRSLLKQTGFSNVRLYGDLAGSPYDHNAKRLIVVAEK